MVAVEGAGAAAAATGRRSEFGVGGQVGLEVGRLGKTLGATRLGTGVRPVTRVDTQVGAEVEVEGETFATTLQNR